MVENTIYARYHCLSAMYYDKSLEEMRYEVYHHLIASSQRAMPVILIDNMENDVVMKEYEDIPPELNESCEVDYRLVALDCMSEEYAIICCEVFKTADVKIQKIERVENPTKYQQYLLLKRKIEGSIPKDIPVERKLFHGTHQKNIPSICNNGFDRSLSGQNGTFYGWGTYFARDFVMSQKYSAHTGIMFYAFVITGRFTKGNSSMKAAPDTNVWKPNGCKYDSVVDDLKNSKIFVVFTDNHAYPAYLITYE